MDSTSSAYLSLSDALACQSGFSGRFRRDPETRVCTSSIVGVPKVASDLSKCSINIAQLTNVNICLGAACSGARLRSSDFARGIIFGLEIWCGLLKIIAQVYY